MPASTSQIRIELTAHGRATLKKLQYSNLLPGLRRELMAATAGIVPEVRVACRATPSKGHSGDSLRRAVANSIRRKVKFFAREIVIIVTAMPRGGKSNLARAMEGEIDWEHPVYGHEGTSVTQDPHPFFYETINADLPNIASRVEVALRKFEAKLLRNAAHHD